MEYVIRPLDPASSSVAVAVKMSVPEGRDCMRRYCISQCREIETSSQCTSGILIGVKADVHIGWLSFRSVILIITDTMAGSL